MSEMGPLTFAQQLDDVADGANVARTCFAGPRTSV